MGDSKIEWTDKTWNPVRGCARVSEGCRHCYSERFAARFAGPGRPYDGLVKLGGKGGPRWTGIARFVPEHLADPLRWRKPARVFVNSMSDLFHDDVTNEQIAAVFGVMAAAPRHTYQILTKRPARMVEWFRWAEAETLARHDRHEHEEDERVSSLAARGFTSPPDRPPTWGVRTIFELGARAGDDAAATLEKAGERPWQVWPLPNVWIGVSVENQAAADERIPLLLQAPAAVRFLSCEPLLGPVDLTLHGSRIRGWDEDWKYDTLRGSEWGGIWRDDEDPPATSPHLDWVIAGCESGPGARPCEVNWLRSLRDQCAAAGVPWFLKQAVGSPQTFGTGGIRLRNFEDVTEGPGSHRKAGGVIGAPYLDGRQHLEMPK